MSILVTCECGRTLRAKETQAGKRCRCPGCGNVLVVPLPTAPAASDTPGTGPQPQVVGETALEPAVVLTYADRDTAGRADPLIHGAERPIPVIAAPPVDVQKLERRFSGNLYWIFLLLLAPLALVAIFPRPNIQQRIERTLADREDLRPKFEYQVANNFPDVHTVLDLLPGKRLKGALLPYSSVFHWVFAVAAAGFFIPLTARALPVEKFTIRRAALTALFTGTLGVLLLIAIQLSRVLCCVTVFYYAALDPSAPFGPSLIGFVFGVGVCEEVIKCLPILWKLWRGTLLNWREACLIGMASGAGFGISEAVLYATRYNGLEGYETYLVRFLSAVTLHVLLSGACAILIQRKQEHLFVDSDPLNWFLTLMAIIIVPIFLHGLFNAFAKQEQIAGCFGVALASFFWLASLIRSSRLRERHIAATAIDETPKVIQTAKGTRWVAPPEPKRSWRDRP